MIDKLFSFRGTIDRREYIGIAFVGVLVKHIVDLAVASQVFHRAWSPLNYIVPLGVPFADASKSDLLFVAAMATISLPFAWVGAAITAKRFQAIGWPRWTVVFFFVPLANIVSFAVAAAWPERVTHTKEIVPYWLARIAPNDNTGAAIFAVLLSAVPCVGLIAFGTKVLGSYGWGLFAAIPFFQGAFAAALMGVRCRPSFLVSISIGAVSVCFTAAALLAVALEGAICIVMAMPIAVAFAAIGGAFGYAILMPMSRGGGIAALIVCICISPALMGAERAIGRPAAVYRVESSIVIDAPPQIVWGSVISFPDLPAPTELPFRVGAAYPIRARIDGSGAGAIRYCQFSTGSFIEPITTWKPGKELAFKVARNPAPMSELSPYGNIDTPHLHDYLTSRRGEFLLQPLEGGRTLLTGITWYQHRLWPAPYWAIFTGAIIHTIHLRVLENIKLQAELKKTTLGSAKRVSESRERKLGDDDCRGRRRHAYNVTAAVASCAA